MSQLVSIVVNCYNGEKYLKKTLESIQAQKYKNWELIFWDNQSEDNSKKFFIVLKIQDLIIIIQRNIPLFMKLEIWLVKNVMENLSLF